MAVVGFLVDQERHAFWQFRQYCSSPKPSSSNTAFLAVIGVIGAAFVVQHLTGGGLGSHGH